MYTEICIGHHHHKMNSTTDTLLGQAYTEGIEILKGTEFTSSCRRASPPQKSESDRKGKEC